MKDAKAWESGSGQGGKISIGRMDNLILSVLQAIGKVTEFVQIVIASLIMVFGTIAFLYTILGWRYVLPLRVHYSKSSLGL